MPSLSILFIFSKIKTIFVVKKTRLMKNKLTFILLLLLTFSCTPKQWVITDVKTSAIAIDSTTDALADKKMKDYIAPIKQNLDREMNQVIGQTKEEMRAWKPESLLSNWTSDVYLQAASEYMKSPVDLAVVNLGSLRMALPKGDITVGNIFQLMPFENELVILWLKGSDVKKLLDIFALEGGQGVSGVKMEIKDGQAVNCLIQGNPIDIDKLYSIATNDFLAGGNDRMIPLASPEKRLDTSLKIRNILMEHVIRETQNGRKIQSQLDGRIRVL